MIVGICGYGYTGSGAVLDYLKGFDECSSLAEDFEFDLSYCPHGIQDLEYHLIERSVRYLSSDTAIREFMRMIDSIVISRNVYTRYMKKDFKRISYQYVQSLVQVEWKGYTRITHRLDGTLYSTFHGVYNRLTRIFEKRYKIQCPVFPWDKMYLSVSPEDFYQKTWEYLKQLLDGLRFDLNKIVVLNQPFEPDQPWNSMKFFSGSKAIVIDRDPRDVYIIVKKYALSNGGFIPSDNVQDFVQYWKQIRKKSKNSHPDVLRVQFEDLIYESEATLAVIKEFCGIQGELKQKVFHPEQSINNTQLFLKHTELNSDILFIEQSLSEYLYPFERYILKPGQQNNVF